MEIKEKTKCEKQVRAKRASRSLKKISRILRSLRGLHAVSEEKLRLLNKLQQEVQTSIQQISDIQKKSEEHLELLSNLHPYGPFVILHKLLVRIKKHFAPKLGKLIQHPPTSFVIPESYSACSFPEFPLKISIVTPSYNHGTYLKRTIHSVLSQEYPNLEYIVQDGASTDQTDVILDSYRWQLSHCESVADKGQSDAVNRGFARSTGEIMAYLNSDDLLLPGSLAYVSKYFAEHPNVDVVYAHRIMIDEDDNEIGRWILPAHSDDVLSWADFVPQETLFWRRGIWDKAGGCLDESFQFAMDWDLLLRFRDAGARFIRLPRFLGAFRVHQRQKTSTQMSEIGLQEMNRLRERCHGRKVSVTEVSRKIRPYLFRHLIYHKLFRLGLLSF